jgi:hypothetical protein
MYGLQYLNIASAYGVIYEYLVSSLDTITVRDFIVEAANVLKITDLQDVT